MPASREVCTSYAKALADTAMMGISSASGRSACMARMALVACSPSIFGIIMSIRMMIRAVLDFFQAVVDFGYRILMQCDIRKADDGIHRGTDIVGHIGEEHAFCFAGGLRRVCL